MSALPRRHKSIPLGLRARSLALVGSLLLAGCDTHSGQVGQVLPVAGGGYIKVMMTSNGPIGGDTEEVAVLRAFVDFDFPSKMGIYRFGFHEKMGAVPSSVTVEDVSDDVPVRLVKDDHPQMLKGTWNWVGGKFVPTVSNCKWLLEIDNSMRLYRFTIETTDHRSQVAYRAMGYPSFIKEFARKGLGLEVKN